MNTTLVEIDDDIKVITVVLIMIAPPAPPLTSLEPGSSHAFFSTIQYLSMLKGSTLTNQSLGANQEKVLQTSVDHPPPDTPRKGSSP